jgi:hypothetical protein
MRIGTAVLAHYQRSALVDKSVKTVVFWLVIVIAASLLWNIVKSGNQEGIPEISYFHELASPRSAR